MTAATTFTTERRHLAGLTPHPKNVRRHSPEQLLEIRASMREFGWTQPILIDEANTILAGHGRREAGLAEGFDEVDVRVARGLSEEQKRAYVLADNQLALNATWDETGLRLELGELHGLGFDIGTLGFSLDALELPRDNAPRLGSLAERFGVPPFSVLSAREGWWQDRKRAWLSLGIQSELGRGENLIGRSPQEVFCNATGIHYGEAREIVTKAMEAQGDAFDLNTLIAKHGGRRPTQAIPGGAGKNVVYRDKANLGKASAGADMSRSGAVMPPGGGLGDKLIETRKRQKAKRKAAAA